MSCPGCLAQVQGKLENRQKAKEYAIQNQVTVVTVNSPEGWTFYTYSYALEKGIPYIEILTYN